MSLETVRDRNGIRLNIGEAIAILALLVTILSGLNGWFILPEKGMVNEWLQGFEV
jgi:hypothetical protein